MQLFYCQNDCRVVYISITVCHVCVYFARQKCSFQTHMERNRRRLMSVVSDVCVTGLRNRNTGVYLHFFLLPHDGAKLRYVPRHFSNTVLCIRTDRSHFIKHQPH